MRPRASVQLDYEKVMIYPKPTGAIRGITEGQVILHGPPQIFFDMKNLYPWSETWARIYSGTYNPANEDGKFIAPVYVAYWNPDPGADPLTTTIALSDWSDLVLEDGVYTIELLTQSPFFGGAPEMLAHLTFTSDRTVEVNGQVISSE